MTGIAFDKDFSPVPGQIERVSPLVRRIVCNNPGPFTFTGTNTYIVGHGEVMVIDPGPEDDSHFRALQDALQGETVTGILVTHTHTDHSPLASRLKAVTGAPIFAFGAHGSGRISRAQPHEAQSLDASGDLSFAPDILLADRDTLSGRNFHVTSIFTPGHTSNHMAYRLEEERALFSGDHVMAWSTTVIAPPDGHMAQYISSLRRLIEDPADLIYWPGHGPARAEPHTLLRATLAHRQMREAAIFERIRAGNSHVPEIVQAVYAGLDVRLRGAAALSTLAHIEHLIENGRVSTDSEITLDAEYKPT